jgi:hypothetical protein
LTEVEGATTGFGGSETKQGQGQTKGVDMAVDLRNQNNSLRANLKLGTHKTGSGNSKDSKLGKSELENQTQSSSILNLQKHTTANRKTLLNQMVNSAHELRIRNARMIRTITAKRIIKGDYGATVKRCKSL